MAPTVSALLSAPMKPGVAGSSIASRWRELHGAQSWAGLLHPLDDDLRAFLIAYGELVSAAHDGFNNEVRSPHHGTCMYSHADVLAASTVSHPEYYTVTKFLYAISGGPATMFGLPVPVESNWMGYVAVATDEGVAALGRRDIVVAWRGTERDSEMANDLDVLHKVSAAPVLGPFAAFHPRAVLHHGFLSMYTSTDKDSKYNKTSARDQVLQEVRRLMEVHKDEVTSITVAGHSLGASLATLNAVDIVANGFNNPHSIHQQPCPVAAILFACPHVGNDKFKSALASFQHLRALHVKNAPDIMPHLPGPLLGFVDAATMALHIDTGRSPYLYPRNDDVSHNLECYLHAIDGDHGDGMDFKLVMGRDIALVNKNANVLKDEYPVPANWWVAKNKWMIKGADGQWKLDDFKEG